MRILRVVPVSLLLGACALGGGSMYPESAPARTARDVPDRFVTADMPAGATASDTLPGSGCRNPLVDPRDGTRLTLMASTARVGDYDVPVGRYGVGARERLRVECNTGRIVGVVPAR